MKAAPADGACEEELSTMADICVNPESCTQCRFFKTASTRPNPVEWDGAIIIEEETGQYESDGEGLMKSESVEDFLGKNQVLYISSENDQIPTFSRQLLRLIDVSFPEGTIHVISMKPLANGGTLLANSKRFKYHKYHIDPKIK